MCLYRNSPRPWEMSMQNIEREENLLDIIGVIGGASDVTIAETKNQLLAKFPFASDLQQKNIVIADLSIVELEEAIYTAAYIGLDASALVDELWWKAGEMQETFDCYFQIDDDKKIQDSITVKLVDKKKFETRRYGIVIYQEFRKRLPDSFLGERVHLRCSQEISAENCASVGNLRLLKFLHEHKCNYKVSWFSYNLCGAAAEHGHLDCLMFLCKCKYEGYNSYQTTAAAARGGHLDCLKFLCETNCRWNTPSSTARAAEYGHLDCLKYLRERGCKWNRWACARAAENGHLECLKYAHENKCPWDEKTCMSAAQNGHLDCLKYAHENGCEWGPRTCMSAAEKGQLNCLKYAHENGCGWDQSVCAHAAAGGHLNCLQYACEAGCTWDEETCEQAALHGHLICLKYAHENKCPWDELTPGAAARGGHLDCLKYARENGCARTTFVCTTAAQGGSLDCLRYLYEQKCPITARTCEAAAQGGFLDCLMFLHERGCKWDKGTTIAAAYAGHLNCLRYAHIHGCHWDGVTLSYTDPAVQEHHEWPESGRRVAGRAECRAYAIENGCSQESHRGPFELDENDEEYNDDVAEAEYYQNQDLDSDGEM